MNYWESSAAFSGDVENPGKNFPRGLAIAVALVAITGFFPILIGTGASSSSSNEWTDGYFIHLGMEIGGPWLGIWLIIASGLTNIGMFVAEMSADAWMIAGMADRGMIPKVLGHRNKYETPTYGVLLSAIGILCLSSMSFIDIVDMLNLVFCMGQVIEFCAFIYLRAYRMDIYRPYTVPLSLPVLCIILALPIAFIGIIIAYSSTSCLILTAIILVMGVLMYSFVEYTRSNNLCEFAEVVDESLQYTLLPTAHGCDASNGMLRRAVAVSPSRRHQHYQEQQHLQQGVVRSGYGSMEDDAAPLRSAAAAAGGGAGGGVGANSSSLGIGINVGVGNGSQGGVSNGVALMPLAIDTTSNHHGGNTINNNNCNNSSSKNSSGSVRIQQTPDRNLNRNASTQGSSNGSIDNEGGMFYAVSEYLADFIIYSQQFIFDSEAEEEEEEEEEEQEYSGLLDY